MEIKPSEVMSVLSKHMLVDGYDLVVDLKNSCGNYLVDARSGVGRGLNLTSNSSGIPEQREKIRTDDSGINSEPYHSVRKCDFHHWARSQSPLPYKMFASIPA